MKGKAFEEGVKTKVKGQKTSDKVKGTER